MYQADLYRCSLIKEKSIKYGKVTMPEAVVEIMRGLGCDAWSEEYMYLICLDVSGQVAGIHEVSHGTANASICSPRDIFKRALVNNAVGIILAHNHPSGDPTPSDTDVVTAKKVTEAGKLLDIKVLDHIILGDNRYYSFQANELM